VFIVLIARGQNKIVSAGIGYNERNE